MTNSTSIRFSKRLIAIGLFACIALSIATQYLNSPCYQFTIAFPFLNLVFFMLGAFLAWQLLRLRKESIRVDVLPGEDAKAGVCTDLPGVQGMAAEEKVLAAYREKETVLNRISDAVVSVNNDWRYTFLNDAALATHAMSREGTQGKVIWDVHPELRGMVFFNAYHDQISINR